MSGRDHSCPECGRGGMNDPTDLELARLRAIEKAAKSYADGYARDCAGNHEPFAAQVVANILAGRKWGGR